MFQNLESMKLNIVENMLKKLVVFRHFFYPIQKMNATKERHKV